MNDDKRSKMWGEPVSKEEVLQELGDPATWEQNSRQIEFRNRLKSGQDDLDISGIRGYGRFTGYLAYLTASLARPLGTGTGLVSEDAEREIARVATEAIAADIAKYEARLAELERSPDAIRSHIGDMRRWLHYVQKIGPMDPDAEDLDELKELARESNAQRVKEIAELEADIVTYELRLAALSSPA